MELHPGIVCDGCEACPLVGARFKSLDHGDFDLCQACYAKEARDAARWVCMEGVAATVVGSHYGTDQDMPDTVVISGAACHAAAVREPPIQQEASQRAAAEAPAHKDSDKDVAELTEAALGLVDSMSEHAAKGVLAELLHHPNQDVRAAIAVALQASLSSAAVEGQGECVEALVAVQTDAVDVASESSQLNDEQVASSEDCAIFSTPECAEVSAKVLSGSVSAAGIQREAGASGDASAEFEELL